MRRQFGIAIFIVLASVFLGACDRPFDLAGNLDGSTKELSDLAQVSDLLLGDADSKDAAPFDGASRAEPTSSGPTPTPTPEPDSPYVFEGFVEEMNEVLWIIDGQVVKITDTTLFIGEIKLGDNVQVTAVLGQDGVPIALEIQYQWTPAPEFIDRVYEIGERQWVVGEIRVILLNSREHQTEIIGDIQVGDLVQVNGILQGEGIVAALEIRFVERPDQESEYFGRVYEMDGPLWIIGDHDFSVDEQTEIVGAIERGDLVKVYGDQNSDGRLYAVKIELLEGFPPFTKAEFTGRVWRIIAEPWIIGFKAVWTNEHTRIYEDIKLDDWVEVYGYYEDFQNERHVVALEIKHAVAPVEDVEFRGNVEEMSLSEWLISGLRVEISEDTVIIGDGLDHIHLGDFVDVNGNLESGGSVTAFDIRYSGRDAEDIEFIGRVQEIDGYLWLIGDYEVEVRSWTEIEGDIGVGDRVKVVGHQYLDGTVEALIITLLDQPENDREVEFTGRVREMGRFLWVIGNNRVLVTPFTKIEDDISIGDLVKVRGVRWFGGVIVAREIQLLERGPDLPEVEFTGRVHEMGERFWLIGDHRVLVTEQTEIIGDIQVGDLVRVRGFQRDGVIVARQIKLLERPDREVEFIGRVKEIGERIWLIADRRVRVTERTEIEGDIQVGDLVKVQGFRRDGVIVARKIMLLERPDPIGVEFIGRVHEMGDRIWLIGDRRVLVNERTVIEGDIQVGDLVKVQGFVGDEGLVVARKITLLERPDIEVEFIGRVHAMGERFWVIGDHRVLVTDQTKIEGDIEVGDMVKVHGFQRDGVIVARKITLLERTQPIEVEFIGRVKEMGEQFWLIGDHRVRITERTRIEGEIEVGDLVKVRGTIAIDSVVVASEIKLVAFEVQVGDGEVGNDVGRGTGN